MLKIQAIYISPVKEAYPEYWPQFFTATIYKWQHLLLQDKHKDVIISSLEYLVKE